MRTFAPALALLASLSALAPRLDAQGTTVILVRHAEKAAPTGDPDLTPAGHARARALADTVARFHLDGVIVTQYLRTQRTAAPAATARGLVPVLIPVDSVPPHADSVAAAVRRFPPHSAVLVVGHNNTLGPIIKALGGPSVRDLCDAEYATLFVLTLAAAGTPARLARTSYGAPDPPGAGACSH
jgi:broad specificity phosphatase PhoE